MFDIAQRMTARKWTKGKLRVLINYIPRHYSCEIKDELKRDTEKQMWTVLVSESSNYSNKISPRLLDSYFDSFILWINDQC